MITQICDTKQGYTQYGGLRPFGVSFLFAGYDEHYGFQLYHTDPSGNYSGWKATVIGSNNQAGKSILKTDYIQTEAEESKMTDEDDEQEAIPDMEEALKLAVKVLNKTMDGTGSAAAEKMELFTMRLDDKKQVVHHIMTKKEAQKVIDDVETEAASAGDS